MGVVPLSVLSTSRVSVVFSEVLASDILSHTVGAPSRSRQRKRCALAFIWNTGGGQVPVPRCHIVWLLPCGALNFCHAFGAFSPP